MSEVTVALLGLALLLAPGPALAARRLGWLAARDDQPVPARSPDLVARSRLRTARWQRLLLGGRDAERCRAELAAVVTVLRDEYAAGATIAAAFTAAAALPGRFRAVLAEAATLARGGRDVASALAAEPRLAALAVACDLAGRNGAPLGPALAGVHAELAADQRTARAVRTALAGPRSSAFLLAGLRFSAWPWAARWARRRSGCCCTPAPAGWRWPWDSRSNWLGWPGRLR